MTKYIQLTEEEAIKNSYKEPIKRRGEFDSCVICDWRDQDGYPEFEGSVYSYWKNNETGTIHCEVHCDTCFNETEENL